MSKLSKFLGKSKEIEIEGEKINIYPLKVKHLQLFAGKENASDEEKLNLSKEMIKKSLLDEDVTDEEIDSMDQKVYTNLLKEINILNGFVDENIDKIRLTKKLRQQGESNESK